MVNIVEKDNKLSPIAVYIYDFSVQSVKDGNTFDYIDFSDILCKKRREEIENIRDLKEKYRKYYSWKLLQFALAKRGVDIKKQSFFRNKNGKWFANNVYFSISHTQNIVAVAVADCEVGIDIEKSDRTVDKALFDKIACEEEKEAFFSPAIKDILTLWTEKEAIFKRNGEEIFIAKDINTLAENVKTIVTEDEGLIISVSSFCPIDIKLFIIKNLS